MRGCNGAGSSSLRRRRISRRMTRSCTVSANTRAYQDSRTSATAMSRPRIVSIDGACTARRAVQARFRKKTK